MGTSTALVSAGGKTTVTTVAASPLQVLDGVREVVRTWSAHADLRERELTQRETIRAERDVQIERLRQETLRFKIYMERTYADRARMFDHMFARLDKSIDQGDRAVVEVTLGMIGQLIEQNPLQNYVRSTIERIERSKPGDVIDI
jgi:hypothetical protein